jgi:5-methyltetrahydrofolate--homocysteine methyltransferase
MNCATGPEFMTDHIRTLTRCRGTASRAIPTRACPTEGKYGRRRNRWRRSWRSFADHGWLNSWAAAAAPRRAHPRHRADGGGQAPRRAPRRAPHRAYYSGIELVEAEESNRPLIVGERTNVIGSRLFKNLVAEEKWEEATEIARRQVRNGAHIVDVCLQSTDRDEMADIPPFYEKLIRKIKAPVMIDTTDPRRWNWRSPTARARASSTPSTWRTARRSSSASARSPSATARRWWWAPSTKTSCRRRPSRASANWRWPSAPCKLLTEKYGIPPEDIIIDPLVFPCATGDANYIGGAVETIEGIRLVKENICRT